MTITLDDQSIKVITMFENMTKARVRDCIILEDEDRITFIVNQGHLRLAVGKGGENVKRMRDRIKKNIDIIEYAKSPERFVRNIFHNYTLESVTIEEGPGGKFARVKVKPKDKGRIIGKGGRNLNLARKILLRHHDVQNISIE